MSRHREWDLECKVYIGNLESETARGDLEGLFSKYGNLKNVWIARNPPGFAFVEFEDPRDAEDAVKELDGTRFCGNKIRVQMSTGRKRQDGGKGDGNRRSPRYEPYKGRNDSNGGRSGPARRSRSRSPRRDVQSTFKDSRRPGRDTRRSRSRSHTPSDRG